LLISLRKRDTPRKEATHTFGKPIVTLLLRRQRVTDLRNNINGRDPVIGREMVSLGHCFVCECVELLWISLSSFAKEVEIVRGVTIVGEAETFAWPAWTKILEKG
jgi:hypothetical protein